MGAPFRLAACAALALGAALPSPPLRTAATPKELSASLDALVPKLMEDGDVPGLALAVVADGRVLYQRAYGVKDASTRAPIEDDTVFEAASLSKPVFAYAVLKLVDAGTIDLDAPVQKYLPGDYVEDPRLRSITPRRVLSHTTGFPNWRQGRELQIHFAPGERFSYSGEGFVYLQKAVEHTTGETLDRLMQRLVFDPLGMSSSSYSWQERYETRKARGHDEVGTPKAVRRPAEAVSAATLHTTVGDYARFVIASLDGTGLKRATWNEMLRPQVRVDQGCHECISKKPTGQLSKEIAWGLGWGLQETEDGEAIWHWGDNGSGFHCYAVGYPRARRGFVVFTNGLGGHGIIPEILAAALGGRQPATEWIDYERWDSPTRTFFKDVLARGTAAVRREGLTEQQVNRVGYWLLAKKRVPEAIAVFEMNAADFPGSWNVHDSLGEAYAAAGRREKAVASYERSLKLNPGNANGAEALKKLQEGSPSR